MARTKESSWLVDETEQGSIVVSIDETNGNTIIIQQGDDDPIWVAPADVAGLVAALRAAEIVALGRNG